MLRNFLLIFLLSVLIFGYVFGENKYIPFNPSPSNGETVVPINGVVTLSWDTSNPYNKTISYLLEIEDGEGKKSYKLKENHFKLTVSPGKTYRWRVSTIVYDKTYPGRLWNFIVPLQISSSFGTAAWDYFIDVEYMGKDTFWIAVRSLEQSRKLFQTIQITSSGKELKKTTLEATDFEVFAINGNRFFGAIYDRNVYLPAVIENNSTNILTDKKYALLKEFKSLDNNSFLILGKAQDGIAVLQRLNFTGSPTSSVVELPLLEPETLSFKDELTVVAGFIKKDSQILPAVTILRDHEITCHLELPVVGRFTDAFVTKDGIYLLGEISGPFGQDNDLLLVKLDTTGHLLWKIGIDNDGDDVAGDIKVSGDDVIVVGSVYRDKDYDIYLFKTDLDGKSRQVYYTDSDTDEFASELYIGTLGYHIFGWKNIPGKKSDVLMRFIYKGAIEK